MLDKKSILEALNSAFPKLKNAIGLNQNKTSQFLAVDPGTLKNWRDQGIGPTYIQNGGSVLYPKDAICEYLLENQIKTA